MEIRKSSYEALRIEIFLASDIVVRFPITIRFDALLQKLSIDEDASKGIYYPEIIEYYHLPLRRLAIKKHPELWFWDCSNALLVGVKIRRFDTIKKQISTRGMLVRSINIASGKYTHNITTFERIQVDAIRFFCYGIQEIIEPLLKNNLHNIGALRKDGFGVVDEIKIERVDMPFCCWDKQSEILLRDVPLGDDPFKYLSSRAINIRYGRFRPPYNPEQGVRQFPLIAEGTKVDLCWEVLN